MNASRATLVFLSSVSLLAAGCSQPPPPKVEVVRPVKTMVVAAGGETRERLLPGTVEASRRVELAFQVPGILAKLPAREGQNVAKGELIAQLRQDEFQAQLKSRQSQLDQARAALEALRAGDRPEQRRRSEAQVRATAATLANARAALNRLSSMLSTGAISQQEFDNGRTAYLVAQEEHASARELLEKGTIGREEDIDAKQAEVRGLEARVVEANLQLAGHHAARPLRRRHRPAVRRAGAERPGQAAGRALPGRRRDRNRRRRSRRRVMAADIRSRRHRADVCRAQRRTGRAVPGPHPRDRAAVADPTTQTFRMRVAMKVPPGVTVLPGMTATVTMTYRRASILGERDPGAGRGRLEEREAGSRWSGSSARIRRSNAAP